MSAPPPPPARDTASVIHFRDLSQRLRQSIDNKSKRATLHIYDEVEQLDLEAMPADLLEEYDALIDEANDFLLG